MSTSPQEMARAAALAVGGLQFLANAASLARGPLRIRAELQAGNLTERFADLLAVPWTYGCVANLFVAVLLFLLAGPLRDGDGLAWRIAAGVGGYYVVVAMATYALGVRRHPGLMAFLLFGLMLLVPLWSARAHYGQ